MTQYILERSYDLHFSLDVLNCKMRLPQTTNTSISISSSYLISTNRDSHYTLYYICYKSKITVTTKGFRGWSDTSSRDNCFFCRSPELSFIRHDLSKNFGVNKNKLCIKIHSISHAMQNEYRPRPCFTPVCLTPFALISLINLHHFLICALSCLV
jgi:hypothetical protein